MHKRGRCGVSQKRTWLTAEIQCATRRYISYSEKLAIPELKRLLVIVYIYIQIHTNLLACTSDEAETSTTSDNEWYCYCNKFLISSIYCGWTIYNIIICTCFSNIFSRHKCLISVSKNKWHIQLKQYTIRLVVRSIFTLNDTSDQNRKQVYWLIKLLSRFSTWMKLFLIQIRI